MNNAFDEIRAALAEAREANRAADEYATKMAEILRGRLRHVRPWYLKQLKKELTQFDAQKQMWKE